MVNSKNILVSLELGYTLANISFELSCLIFVDYFVELIMSHRLHDTLSDSVIETLQYFVSKNRGVKS